MASTFKFHSKVNETVPWQAQYSFPSQATRVNKQTVKLPPKNGGTFAPGNIVRIEFPADNYFNALNSVLQFDLAWTAGSATDIRLQRGGAQNVIKRLRVMYGSLVLEDIQEYKTIVRILTESGVQNDYMSSIGTILDGMYEPMEFMSSQAYPTGAVGASVSNVNWDNGTETATTLANQLSEVFIGGQQVALALSAAKRTYCLNLLSGILTSKKLIPLKWMAAQLSIELTLADVGDCCISQTAAPTSYVFDNCNYITEMLEFDSSYDAAFFSGLESGGVPIKFSSWHFHSFSFTGATQIFQIHERSRSVKAAFAVVRTTNTSSNYLIDSDNFFHAAGATDTSGVFAAGTTGPIDSFQWRVGGRYYPAQPVKATNGGSEALVELLKCVNSLGDYTKASCINYLNWVSSSTTNPGSKFIMACEFENIDVMPDTIAGINAEEQSDIALIITLTSGTPTAKKVDVFMHYDALLIVKSGNTVDLVM